MTDRENELFGRSRLLLGDALMEKLHDTKAIIFGIGGVGSWCAEGLVRSGLSKLTIVDADTVSLSNVNRQLMASTSTVGRVKVDVLRERLSDINPDAEILAIHKTYSAETAQDFDLDSYNYVIDAIDSLKDKAALVLKASASKAEFYSAMGAALKVDPERVKVGPFSKVIGCPLASRLRKKLKKMGEMPAKDFTCVWDDEVLENRGEQPEQECSYKAVTNGSMAAVTGIFGLTLSGLVIRDLYRRG